VAWDSSEQRVDAEGLEPVVVEPSVNGPIGAPNRPGSGAVSGVVGASALVIAMCVLSLTPSVDSTPAAVRSHLGSHYPVTMAAAYAIVVAALLLVPFLASLRNSGLRRPVIRGSAGQDFLVSGECVLADRADSSPSSGLFQRGPAGRPPRRCRLWPHR
jgi:hypothetical protein